MRNSVDLPPPDGPEECGELAVGNLQAHVVQGDERAETFDQMLHGDAHVRLSLGLTMEIAMMHSAATAISTIESW